MGQTVMLSSNERDVIVAALQHRASGHVNAMTRCQKGSPIYQELVAEYEQLLWLMQLISGADVDVHPLPGAFVPKRPYTHR